MKIQSHSGKAEAGFTLIEMAIVLVVIGLIVGGVLVGQNLITAAEVRATITQVEKYNTAANTFRGKFNALPGDLNAQVATQFGFTARGTFPGQGDGNGIIEGYNNATNTPIAQTGGETALFWVDLTYANGMNLNLIEGGFTIATIWPVGTVPITGLSKFFPQAKMGRGNYVYVFSGGVGGGDGNNYFGIAAITSINSYMPISTPNVTAQEAYSIDSKVDDGLPQSGNVKAVYMNDSPPWGPINSVHWASGASGVDGANSGSPNYGATTSATPGSSTTCYDNGNATGATQQYSLGQNNGAGPNCALTFKFQ